ncbi:CRISPR-associated endoribonuclease Cas6 [Proteiniborus sp.]|uniref:CRISPR-associated endoribonuclease Cas6 n=1 Tax=Proteiniborus sp. TaxID=2079015 RepID=UPI003324BF0A
MEAMQYFEITVTTYLLRDMYFTDSSEIISKIINKAMLLDNDLSEKHKKNDYKNYVFNNFYPLENNKTYRRGRIYIFKIRTLDKVFAKKIRELIMKIESEDIKIIATDIKTIWKKHIVELYTVTPALITVDNKYWLPENDFILLQDRFNANLEKKYKAFYDNNFSINHSFIQRIELLNKIPFSFKYKNTRLLANKFRIIPNDDEQSQLLAFTAEAIGIGEKNSAAGLGFCNAQYLK